MNIDWQKIQNEVPVIVQDAKTLEVLMLGYMNPAALEKTLQTKQVTFYSRTKKRLWTKGETSGNTLSLVEISADCDQDALLITVKPNGPTCHQNTRSCFDQQSESAWSVLCELEARISQRQSTMPDKSYTADLFRKGVQRIAQKIGEEGVEVALAAVTESSEALISESADLLFHLLVLLREKELCFTALLDELKRRAS